VSEDSELSEKWQGNNCQPIAMYLDPLLFMSKDEDREHDTLLGPC
jgi:hypothetical protein